MPITGRDWATTIRLTIRVTRAITGRGAGWVLAMAIRGPTGDMAATRVAGNDFKEC